MSHAATSLLVNAANLMSFAILWIVKFIVYNKLFHIDPIEYEEHHAEKVAAAVSDPDEVVRVGAQAADDEHRPPDDDGETSAVS